MISRDDESSLILDIYDTTFRPETWPEVLDRIAHFAGASGAFLFELHTGEGKREVRVVQHSGRYDAEMVRQYMLEHNEQEFLDQAIFAEHSQMVDKIELIPDTVLAGSEAELLARPNVKRMMELGIRYRAGTLLNKDVLWRDRFALQYSVHRLAPDRDELARAGMLLRHVAKATALARPVQEVHLQKSWALSALDHLQIGICLIDAQERIVLMNSEFQRQLDTFSSIRKTPDGRLRIEDSRGGRWELLRQDPRNHGQFGARPRKEAIIPRNGPADGVLCVEVLPLTATSVRGSAHENLFLVTCLDTSLSYDVNISPLQQMFALTDAETAVYQLIARGHSNTEISAIRERSTETIKKQVASILAKTGTENRVQAVRLATSVNGSFLQHTQI